MYSKFRTQHVKYFRLIIFAVFVLVIAAKNTKAQTDFGFKLGATIPGSIATGTYDPLSTGFAARLGIDAGSQIEFHKGKHWSFQMDLEYSQQGGRKVGAQAFAVPSTLISQFPNGQAPPALYAYFKSSTHLNYLNLPLLAKYHFSQGDNNVGFYVAGGPYIGFLINANYVAHGNSIVYLDNAEQQALNSNVESFNYTNNITSQFSRISFGGEALIGLDLKLSQGKCFAEAGGNMGFLPAQKTSTNGQYYNVGGFIRAGYMWTLHPKEKTKKTEKK